MAWIYISAQIYLFSHTEHQSTFNIIICCRYVLLLPLLPCKLVVMTSLWSNVHFPFSSWWDQRTWPEPRDALFRPPVPMRLFRRTFFFFHSLNYSDWEQSLYHVKLRRPFFSDFRRPLEYTPDYIDMARPAEKPGTPRSPSGPTKTGRITKTRKVAAAGNRFTAPNSISYSRDNLWQSPLR